MEFRIYFPYKANDGKHKYYIITNQGKKIYFGASGMSDYTIHNDPERKLRYINRHKKREEHLWNKSGINSPSWWSLNLLWSYPSIKEAYEKIKKDLLKWNIITKKQYNSNVF
jgi:hypothetical protein